jgi:hypothetical protein
VEQAAAAVFEADFAVDEEGVGAGGGAVEGPGELLEGERQAVQREMDAGARVAQALGGLAEEDGERGGELWIGGVEGLAEFEELLAGRVRGEGGSFNEIAASIVASCERSSGIFGKRGILFGMDITGSGESYAASMEWFGSGMVGQMAAWVAGGGDGRNGGACAG